MRVLLFFLALIASGMISIQWAPAEQVDKVAIGFIGVYSGPLVPAENERTARAVSDTVSEINKGGGVLGKHLTVFWEDSRRDPKFAHTSAVKLLHQERVQFVLIHGDPECAITASRVLAEYKVSHVAVLIGSPNPAAQAAALLEAWVERVTSANSFDLSR